MTLDSLKLVQTGLIKDPAGRVMFGHQPKFWFYNVPWGKTTKTSMLKHKLL